MKEQEIEELDRILAEEEELLPSSGFSARVMQAVREEAAEPPPLSFPWARFVPGLLINLVLLVGAAAWGIAEGGVLSLAFSPSLSDRLLDAQWRGVFLAALVMVGTLGLAWAALRWVAPARRASSL